MDPNLRSVNDPSRWQRDESAKVAADSRRTVDVSNHSDLYRNLGTQQVCLETTPLLLSRQASACCDELQGKNHVYRINDGQRVCVW